VESRKVSVFNDWKNCINLKVSIYSAGKDMYRDWYELSADEIWMHVGLYILNRLLPSLRTEMKLKR
jgi:hypothetical protein